MTQSSYNAEAIEVLSGLEPVRRRPGMYTDTSRPNHLAQEVIDNSVDEALAGHASHIEVILHADQSLEVIDDGRGMPVDIHPEMKVSAVELILGQLHAGGNSPIKTTNSQVVCMVSGFLSSMRYQNVLKLLFVVIAKCIKLPLKTAIRLKIYM